MPATKDAMTRYQILDDLLSNRYHNYSIDDLTEEVCKRLSELYPNSNGVTRRCIEKDLHYLEYDSPFMVDIERFGVEDYDHLKKKYYIKRCLRYNDPSYSIFKKELSSDEKYLLKEALSLLVQFEGLPNLHALEQLREEMSVHKNDKQIISFTKNPLGESNLLGELFTAISNKQVIKMEYVKFSEPNAKLKVVLHPYLLKEYNRRWFLIASADDDQKLLCFALDRIKKVKTLPAHRYVEYDGDLNERFEDIIGVTLYDKEPLQHIEFWVSDTSKDYVRTKPIHESQILHKGEREKSLRIKYPQLIGGYFFSIDCIRNYELIRELFMFSKDLLVLSPQSIREEIYSKVCEMKELYNNVSV